MKATRVLQLVLALLMIVGAVWAAVSLRQPSWRDRLRSADPVVVEAARAELLVGEEDQLRVLRDLLRPNAAGDWSDQTVVLQALEIVSQLGPTAHVVSEEVVALTQADDPLLRDLAAQTIPAIGAKADVAVPALHGCLQRAPSVPALRALSEYGAAAEPAVGTLVDIMSNQELPTETRWNAVRTLGKTRDGAVAAIDALVQHLNDPQETVREHAAEALGDIGPAAKRTTDDLLAVLNDPYVKVRRDAVRSLGQIDADPEKVLPAIKPLLEDPEEIVRLATQNTISILQPVAGSDATSAGEPSASATSATTPTQEPSNRQAAASETSEADEDE